MQKIKSKLGKIYQWPYDYGELVKFKSKFSLNESINRLEKVTRKKRWCILLAFTISKGFGSELAGKITKDNVILVRTRSAINIATKPQFVGKFIEDNGNVILNGYFDVGCLQKFSFWVSLLVILSIESVLIIGSIFDPEKTLYQKLFTILFIPVLYLFVQFLSFLLRGFIYSDIKWISDKITETLQGDK